MTDISARPTDEIREHTFSWSFYSASSPKFDFDILVEKTSTGVKAEYVAKADYNKIMEAITEAGIHYTLEALFFRDRPTYYLIQCAGQMELTHKRALRGIFQRREEERWWD